MYRNQFPVEFPVENVSGGSILWNGPSSMGNEFCVLEIGECVACKSLDADSVSWLKILGYVVRAVIEQAGIVAGFYCQTAVEFSAREDDGSRELKRCFFV